MLLYLFTKWPMFFVIIYVTSCSLTDSFLIISFLPSHEIKALVIFFFKLKYYYQKMQTLILLQPNSTNNH